MKISEIAEFLQGNLVGDGNAEIRRVAAFDAAQTGEITFLEKTESISASNASCLIVPENFEANSEVPLIRVRNPKLAFAKIAAIPHPPKKRETMRHESAVISESARLGENLFIGAFVTIGDDSEIGDGTQIRA